MSASGAGVGEHFILDSEELGKPRELVASLSLFLMCRSMARSDALCMRDQLYTFHANARGLTLITMDVVLETRLKCLVRTHRSSRDLVFSILSSMSSKLFSFL
jgi:hypothetical protein